MKKSVFESLKKVVFAAFAVIPLVSFYSCGEDAGLGATVDAEAPVLSIAYPPSSSVIREDFVLSGTCSDDKSISSVSVKVVNVETKETLETTNATVTGNKWSVSLNKKKSDEADEWGLIRYSYPDGKYEISVVAYDGAGHSSGTNSRTVEIDNTPPVFFITSPQIDDESDMTNYGTRLKITGTIADAHKVARMAVIVRDKDGNVVADSENNPITINNVTTAGGTSETIASYLGNEGGEGELNETYISIYFDGDAEKTRTGAQEYKAEIFLSDEAQIYRPDSSEQGNIISDVASFTGNTTDKLFAYYNIRDLVGADLFDANTLMQVISGTYSGENLDTLKSALMAAGNSTSTAKFTLNPKANPTYSVIGFAFDKKTVDGAKTAWNESGVKAKFSVVATQGLNQDAIDKNSEKAYLVGPFTAYSSVEEFIANKGELLKKINADMEELSDSYLYDSVTDSNEVKASHAAKNEEIWSNYLSKNKQWREENGITIFDKLELTGDVSGSGESYTYPYTLPEELPVSDAVYLFFATGRDKEGLCFTTGDSYYGFKLAVTGNKPTFKGVCFVKNDDSEDVLSANSYSNLGDLSVKGSANCDSGKILSVKYSLKVTDESVTDDNDVLTLSGGMTYDDEDSRLQNQPFSFNLLEKASDAEKVTLLAAGKRYLYTVDLETEAQPGGNFQTQYIVHIDTKKPEVEITKAEVVYTDKKGRNWVGQKGLSCLRGNIDEENPYQASYDIRKNGESIKTGELGGVYSFNMTNDEGKAFDGISLVKNDKIDVKFSATDKAGNKSEEFISEEYYADITPPVLVTADEDSEDRTKPGEIRIGGSKYNSEDKSWRKDTALTFEGWYKEEESGISAILYSINPSEIPTNGAKLKEIASGAMGADSNGKFSSTISGFNPSGKSTIYLAAEDNVGNLSGRTNYDIYIDQIGPEFTEVAEDEQNIPANGTKDVAFEIVVKDQESASGIDTDNISVTAIYNGTLYPLSSLGENAFKAEYDSTNGILKGTIKKEFISGKHNSVETNSDGSSKKSDVEFNGNVTLQIEVPDKAGNSSTNQQFILKIDSSAPGVSITAPKSVAENEAVENISWITGKTTIQGTITDVGVAGVDRTGADSFRYMIPNRSQQEAVKNAGTASERIEALKDAANWKNFPAASGEVTWAIEFGSSYLESPEGKEGTVSAGKASLVHYAYASSGDGENKILTYATEYGSTAEEKKRYRTLPVYFFVTDLAGNQDIIVGNKVYIDIEGGKPAASISYPKESVTDSSGKDSWQKLSEEISLQGVAKDNEAITKIALTELYYASYDTTASDTDSISQQVYSAGENYTGWTKLNLSSDVKIIQPNKNTETLTGSGSDSVIEQTVTGQASVEAFDIEFTLAKEKESDADLIVDKLAKKNKKIIAIKAVVSAFDENEYGYSSSRMAFVDTEAPKLSGAKLVKLDSALAGSGISSSVSSGVQIGRVENGKVYGSDGTELAGKVLIERPYESDMWISGGKDGKANWYYVATVTDDSVVEGVNLTSLSDDAHKVVFKTEKGEMAPASKTKTYTFAIPIPVSSDGSIYSQLALEDGSHKGINEYISINIDNTAPRMFDSATSLVATGDASKTSIDDGKLRLVADGILGEKYVIENSNGSFSFGDKVYETGSGLSFIGFWIERASKKAVYNPIIKEDSAYRIYSSGDELKSAIYATEKPSSAGVYLNSDNLPVLYVPASSVTVGSNSSTKTTTITYSGLAADSFINRAYGRVRINGSYYQVTDISSNTATLDSDLGLKNGSGVVDVEFVYAAFVDKNGTELFQWGSEAYTVSGDESESGSDLGDGLAESLKVKSGVYTWTAEFDSNNIEDGPARIHVVAFDNAGNVNHAYVDTSVQNNRPRIAKVFVATDLNVDNKFKFDEDVFKDYAATFDEAFGQSKADAQNPYLYNSPAVENGLEMGEFVFYSTLDKNNDASAFAVLSDKGVNGNFIAKDAVLILPEIVGGNIAKGDIKYNMEESEADTDISKKAPSEPTRGSNSLAELVTFTNGSASAGGTSISITNKDLASAASQLPQKGIYLSGEALKDYESWTSEGKKSRYLSFTLWDTTGVDTSADSLTQGENTLWAVLAIPMVINVVDEEAPLPLFDTLYWKSKEDSSTVYDENEQPLGHVDTEEDLGKDNPEVAGEIYIRGQVTDGSLVQSISIIEPDSSASVKVAEYKEGKWRSFNGSTPTYFDKTSGEMLEDDSDYKFDVSGLPENWKSFEITSEREPSQKDHKVDFRFRVDTTKFGVVSDQEFKIVASDKENRNTSEPDTAQTTKIAPTSLYKLDFVPYIRTITLADGSEVNRSRLGRYPVRAGEKIRIYGMNFKAGETASVNYYDSKNGISASGSPASTESGTVKTDSVNGNYVEVASPAYSRFVSVTVQGLTTANNTNSNAKGNNIEEGYLASETTTLGLKKASSSGTNFWTDDRYLAVWNVETTFAGSINPHSGVIRKIKAEDTIKSSGSIGIKEKGSLIEPTGDLTDAYAGFISSDDMRTYIYEETAKKMTMCPAADLSLFTAPVDAVDCIILGGLPYYVLQTNYVGNVNANCWGPGLILSREGFAYDRSVYETTTALSESSLPWIIERQGNQNSAMGRDSSTGYDSVLYQFKNPRMAGWHTDSPIEDDRTSGGQALDQTSHKFSRLDYIYVTYYDSYAKCLKYAAFRSGTDVDASKRISLVQQSDMNAQWGGGATSDYALVAEARAANGNMTNGATVVAGHDWNQKNAPTSFTEKAGEWSDIVLDVDTVNNYPVPVIVYYNETNKRLEVARGKTDADKRFPKSSRYGTTDTTGNLTGEDAWTKSNITPNSKVDFGRYVSAAIDKAGNLHVAAQDATNARLYYLYLKKSGEGYSIANSVIVDSTSGAGRWTDIELTNPDGESLAEIKPVISYINTSFLGTTQGVKVAYLESVTGTGSSATLNFEAMTDPAKWQAGDQRTSVLPDVKETKDATATALVGVGFNSDMLALDFLRDE